MEKIELNWDSEQNDLICKAGVHRDGILVYEIFNDCRFKASIESAIVDYEGDDVEIDFENHEMLDPFIVELKNRGYDLTTLKFEISKTMPPEENVNGIDDDGEVDYVTRDESERELRGDWDYFSDDDANEEFVMGIGS